MRLLDHELRTSCMRALSMSKHAISPPCCLKNPSWSHQPQQSSSMGNPGFIYSIQCWQCIVEEVAHASMHLLIIWQRRAPAYAHTTIKVLYNLVQPKAFGFMLITSSSHSKRTRLFGHGQTGEGECSTAQACTACKYCVCHLRNSAISGTLSDMVISASAGSCISITLS